MTDAQELSTHPIAAHLQSCGIEAVAIIDDAYDAPTRESLGSAVPEFWDHVVRREEFRAELQTVAAIEDESDIDNAVLKSLYDVHDSLPKIGALCKQLFAVKLEKLAPLRKLREHLQNAGLKRVVELGSEEELPSEPIKLVFLDYFLGPRDDTSAVQAATAAAEEIYRRVPNDADKPFIVLMSSRPEVDAGKEAFRESSKLLGGLFGFVRKTELTDKEKLYLHLTIWALGMPARHQIQHFAEALEVGVRSAAEDFIRRVRALGFEDYANIQWLSLQQEGHPLGDYMLWLYKSLLVYLFHGQPKVLEQQKQLDAMSFERFTPSQSSPSAQLAEIYRFALTEPGVEEVRPHPRAAADNSDPLLQTGDMFFKEGSPDVLMVINAPCDLAYAPGHQKRSFPRDRPVLLIRGTLQRHEDIDTSGRVRTELFKHEGRPFRILWDHQHVTSKEYGVVAEWLSSEGYARKARLALPYALEVQQAFAMHMMRPGMPIRPPSYRHADVEVYCEGEDGACEQLGESIRAGARIMRRRKVDKDEDEDLFVLTIDCIGMIVSRLDTVVSRLRAQADRLRSQLPLEVRKDDRDAQQRDQKLRGKIQGIEGKLAKVEQLKQASREWVPIVQTPSLLPAPSDKVEVNAKLLWVYHDRTFTGPYTEKPPILLNLRSNRGLSATQATADEPPVGPQESTNA
jgi:hypothetical protein